MKKETIIKDLDGLRQMREAIDKATSFIIVATGNAHQTREIDKIALDDSNAIDVLHALAYARETICQMEAE